jgi:Protein of unknown function (DUF4232)
VKSDAGNPGTPKPGAGRPPGPFAATAVVLVCLAAAVGCASSSSSTTTAPSSSAVTAGSSPASAAPGSTPAAAPSPTLTPPATAPPACPTSSLTVKLGLAQGYAGGVYQVIDFANASRAACTLFGYPGVSLVTGPPYAQVGLAAKRAGAAPVKLVTLAPGMTATALLQIVDAQNYPASTCRPVQATHLRVYPPNQTVSAYLPDPAYGCAKPVPTLFISAVRLSGLMYPMNTVGSGG